ncbi:Lipase member K, partial [Armadillidium vulgare]
PQSIRLKGYPCEEHFVTTKDGYILAMHRIPWGKQGKGRGQLIYLLIRALMFGLTNVRGGDYSRNHTHLSPSSKEFWDFSWDEMAKYDLPKMIDYIVKHTKHKKVDYVGHSMGTTIFFALMSSQPEYNKKINHMIALAPVGTVSHIDTMVKYLSHFYKQLKLCLNMLGDYEIIPNRNSTLIKLFNYVCNLYKTTRKTCENLLFMIV